MGFQQGLSGLNASSKALEAVGNNVANSGTVGFKSANAQFADVFASSLAGSGSGQIGIGANLATVAQQFTQGNITSTNNPLDMAINGNGMFRLSNNGVISYSRNGQFQLDKNGFITTPDGLHLTGYAADANGNIVPGNLVDLQVVNTNIAPQVTTASQIQLNLDSRAKAPTAMTGGSLAGNIVLTSPVTITQGSNDTLQLTVDGVAVNITVPPGTYQSLADFASKVETQINAALGNSGAGVTVTLDTSNHLVIKSKSVGTVGSQGSGSSVVLVGGTSVPSILSASTHGKLTGTLATPLTATTANAILATNNTLTISVDGGAAVTTSSFAGSYSTLADLATTIEGRINAALTAQSKTVTVSVSPTNQLVITSNTTGVTSQVALTAAAAPDAAVALFGASPTIVAGATGPTSSTSGGLTASTVLGSYGGYVTGTVALSASSASPLPATGSLTFVVDGGPTVTSNITGPFTSLASLASAIESSASPAGRITVSVVGSQLRVTSTATGATSSVAAPGGTLAATLFGATPATTTGGQTSIQITQGVNDFLQVKVDGVEADITIPAGTYTAAELAGNPSGTPPVIGLIQTLINKALGTTGKAVDVRLNGTGQLSITSTSSAGEGSTVSLVGGTAAKTLLGSLPVALTGTGPTWIEGGDNFSITNTLSYTSSTSQTVYDSLGNPHNLNIYFVKTSQGNRWQAYTTLDGANLAGPIPMQFNTSGVLTTAMPLTQSYTLNNGATSPLTFTLDFTGSTQYGVNFGVNQLLQDGYTSGRLSSMSVADDGTIQGRYSNGKSRNMGQVVLAKFNNNNGLQSLGGNQWAETAESGQPIPGTPGQGSLGVIQAASVEESNVDLTAELVNMITQQRAYQANAQTIKTMDQILQTLVNLR
ncbi:hypothetical protein DLREEDagrD3_27630 [Denitratisoma sp. agr-D3]